MNVSFDTPGDNFSTTGNSEEVHQIFTLVKVAVHSASTSLVDGKLGPESRFGRRTQGGGSRIFVNPNSGLERVGFAWPAEAHRPDPNRIGHFSISSTQAQISSANWGKVTAPVYGSAATVAGGAYLNAAPFWQS